MNRIAFIRARTLPNTKKEAENVFRALGLTPSQAINLFYQQVSLSQGLPFELKLPTPLTTQTLQETDNAQDLHCTKDAEDLFKELEI